MKLDSASLQELLVYATIPIFALLLLILVLLIANFQLNLPIFPRAVPQQKRHYTPATYMFLGLLLLSFAYMSYIARRKET